MEVTFLLILGLISFVLILLAFFFQKKIAYSVTGVLLIIIAVSIAATSLQVNAITQSNTTYTYGNQTYYLWVVNESEAATTLPHNFTTNQNPIVNNTQSCYYTMNATPLTSEVISTLPGLINISS